LYLTLNKRIWKRLHRSLPYLPLPRPYGAFVHRLVRSRAPRRQYLGTFFFRNRPQLEVIRRVASQKAAGSTLSLACLGCSNGAELYSILWAIRSVRPDLKVIAHAVDISRAILDIAQGGVYSLAVSELVGEPVFSRTTAWEMQQMFDVDPHVGTLSIKPWLREGIRWHLGDAASSEILDTVGPQDIVVANNFLCHMTPPAAERCLRDIARLPAPGGYLFVAGIDLDVRTTVAMDLGWRPLPDLLEAVHDGDPAVRRDWPWEYWGLEPLDKTRRDWRIRYASAFQRLARPQELRS
jgi:SAM-dependent methyltransferase